MARRRPIPDDQHRVVDEQGYALLGTLWLLLLAASLAAAIMARAALLSREAAERTIDVSAGLRIDAAFETAMADIIFNGDRAAVLTSGGRIRYRLNGRDVDVTVSDEGTLLDINEAPFEVIDAQLAMDGVDATARSAFIESLQQRRLSGDRVTSLEQVATMIAQASRSNRYCLQRHLTVYSGRSEAVMPQRLSADPFAAASATGSTSGSSGPFRITVVEGLNHQTVIARGGEPASNPVAIFEHTSLQSCS